MALHLCAQILQEGKEESGSWQPFVVKRHWKPSEDVKLRELVALHGPRNWNTISKQLPCRSSKSCRLRWINHLDPRLKKTEFSKEEDEVLTAAHEVFGNQWSKIAKFIPGRTDNGIKNQWHVLTARRHRYVTGVCSFHHPAISDDSNNVSSYKGTSFSCINRLTSDSALAQDGAGYIEKSGTLSSTARQASTNPFKNRNTNMLSGYCSFVAPPSPHPFIDFLGVGK